MATVGTSSVVEPLDAKRRWVFKTTQNDDLIAGALIKHMSKAGVKTIGFIGFNDPYGENWHKVFAPLAEKAGIRVIANERYPRTDQSVTGQSLKLLGGEARRGADRRRRRPRGAAAGDAARPGLQGHDLPDARGRDRRLHQARQGQGRGHDSRRRADAGHRRDPRRQPDQEGRADLHRGLREAVRRQARDVRRQHLGRRHPAGARDSHRREGRQARHRGVPRRAARRARAAERRSSAARACSTCRRPITTAWTSARACW